ALHGGEPLKVPHRGEEQPTRQPPGAVAVVLDNRCIRSGDVALVPDQFAVPVRGASLVGQDLQGDACEVGHAHAITIPCAWRCSSASSLIACIVRVAASSASFSSSTSLPVASTLIWIVGENVP